MKSVKAKLGRRLLAACVLLPLSTGMVRAEDESVGSTDGGGWFSNMDFDFGGFVRVETAISTTGEDNINNQNGNAYNGVPVRRVAGDPLTGFGPILPGSTLTTLPVIGPLLNALPVVNGQLPLTSVVARPVETQSDWANYHVLRAEAEMSIKFNNDLSLIGRLRTLYDPGYQDFNADSVDDDRDGITGGVPELYRGSPNYFEYRVDGKSNPNPLEIAGKNYLAYFPALFFDYNSGPLNLRVGQQQIAWGQAIFFRVFDVANGIDLRRHSVLDNAQEEFSDKRVPSLAIRTGYQLNDEVLLDSYVEKFQPSIFGNPNTAYNVIPAQFTVHDRYADYDNKFSYGLRMKANYGQWGFQGMAVRRYNPDGVFRWTKSGVDKALPNNNLLGIALNTLYGGTGSIMSETPFEASPGGVYSADEWFTYAASVRLNGITGLNAAVNDFQPATGQLLASPVTSFEAAHNELDTFFMAGGDGLRGHIERKYFQENVFGLGVSYVVEAEPGSILDQLIINLETSYTPNRTFTAPSLGKDFLQEDASITALVMEKYQRFSMDFPATYLVFQAMHRNADDLFGRSLKGYGGSSTSVSTGIGSANYLVLAAQQPFPNDIYRASLAVLYDPRGSILVQPGVKWRPTGAVTVDAFYSYINGDMGGNPNNNLLSTADFADEFTLRVAYQF